MKKPTVYCIAKCSSKYCEQHSRFKPQHGANPTADFSDRCEGFVKVKR